MEKNVTANRKRKPAVHRQLRGVGFQPAGFNSQTGSLCHVVESALDERSSTARSVSTSGIQGFSDIGQVQSKRLQPGQPAPYLSCNALQRSTPATFAIVVSQAITSANSS